MAYQLPYEFRKRNLRLRHDSVSHGPDHCPICGELLPAPDRLYSTEIFCDRCDTLLQWVEDEHVARWVAAGIYT